MSLPLNQLYIKIDLKNLQELNLDEVKEKEKLNMFKFRIDFKENDVNKCSEIPPVILSWFIQ